MYKAESLLLLLLQQLISLLQHMLSIIKFSVEFEIFEGLLNFMFLFFAPAINFTGIMIYLPLPLNFVKVHKINEIGHIHHFILSKLFLLN